MHFFTLDKRHLFYNIVEGNKPKSLERFLYLDKFHLLLSNITKTIKLQISLILNTL